MEDQRIVSPLFGKSKAIPEEIREDVRTVVNRTYGLRPNPADIQYLFEVWNRYMVPAGYPEDISCNACVYKVVKSLRTIVKLWEEQGVIK